MVMDAQPSPQNVGREFVRQYYTLLNKAPDHLHRFYNNSSSFVHGGLDAKSQDVTLVIGQKQIHSKIQQLNFRDCHAKISQVDSQATLGNGVVVQVTGELSNDGQPMRRFTQTFVLAAQSPKKYYVHNDIFRYQDVYTDDELDDGCDGRANGTVDEDGLHGDPTGVAEVIGEQVLNSATATSTPAGGVHGLHGPAAGQPAGVVPAVLGGPNASTPQALYYPAAAAAGLLPSGVTGAYGGAPPSAAQTVPSVGATTPQQQQQAPLPQPAQQLNGLHESLLKNVGAAGDGATAAVVAAVLLSSSNDPQALQLKSKLDAQTPLAVASHLLPGQQQQQQHQSLHNQSQPPTNNQLGLGQSHQQQPQLPVQQQVSQQQQSNRHQLSALNDVDAASLRLNDLSVSSAGTQEMLSSSDLDLQQQQQSSSSSQHKPHHSHPQQKQQLGSGSSTFGKQQQQQQQPPVSLEPKTYANLVKSGVSSGAPLTFASAMQQASLNQQSQPQQQQQNQQQQQQQSQHQQQQQHSSYGSANRQQQQQRDILSPATGAGQNAVANGGAAGGVLGGSKYGSDRQDDRGNNGLQQQRSQQQRSIRSNGTNSSSMGGGGLRQQDNRPSSYGRQNYNDNDDRRPGASAQFGDNHQLFLGNIPHHATEDELKTLFSKFGTVVDLRIMSKPVQKMPGVRTPPHYGFITYDDPASVQNCLSNMPLYFPENSPDGHKLNVEEKKTRVRGPGEGSGRMNNGGGGGGGGGMGSNANSNGPRSGGAGSGQSRPPGGQGSGGVSSNRGGGGSGQRSLGGGGNVGGAGGGGGGGGQRGSGGSYGQRADRGGSGNNVGNGQRSVGNGNAISNRGFGSGY